MNLNLSCSVQQHSIAHPDSLAVSSQERSLSYAQFAMGARAIAACIGQSPGWLRRDGQPPRVGILASRSVDACLGVLGACWAGATYVPIGVQLPEERLLTLLSLCELSALIADAEGAKRLTEAVLSACPPLVVLPGAQPFRAAARRGIEFHDIDALPLAECSAPAAMVARDAAYIIFTSGTTGVPKGVTISARAIRHHLEMLTALLGLQASDRVIETCELSFDAATQVMFAAWEAGASLHVLPAVRVMSAAKFARDKRLTVWISVPSLVGRLKQIKALPPNALPSIRITVFGGEQLSQSVVTAWQAAAPNSVIENLYGPTEATVACLRQRVSMPLPLTPGRDIVANGTAMPGSEAGIVDANGQFVATGVAGELALAGVQLADGYLNAPTLTAARFPTIGGKRWYLTGDLAFQDAQGTFHCLGRIDNQVKVLGHRIELEEIDAHLRIVANMALVATVAWPVVEGGAQGLVAFVGAATVDQEQVIAALKAKLPAYMVPGRVLALENMPCNQSGKVDRRALRLLLERGAV